MYDAGTETIADGTFGAIAARAARYPVIVKRNQPRTIMKGATRGLSDADSGIRWLLFNTMATNQVLKGTGWGASGKGVFPRETFVSDATNRCLEGTV